MGATCTGIGSADGRPLQTGPFTLVTKGMGFLITLSWYGGKSGFLSIALGFPKTKRTA